MRRAKESSGAWTDERIETLKKLVSEGLSASAIARELGSVSRNAVIGKLRRLNIPLLASTSLKSLEENRAARKAAAPRPRVKTEPKRFRQPRAVNKTTGASPPGRGRPPAAASPPAEPARSHVVAEAPHDLRLALLDLRRCQCRWPTARDTENDRWLFCGAPTDLEQSYCGFHRHQSSGTAAAPMREPQGRDKARLMKALTAEFGPGPNVYRAIGDAA